MSSFWYTTNPVNFVGSYLANSAAATFSSYSLDEGAVAQVVQIVPTAKLSFDLDQHRLAPYVFTGAGLMNESLKNINVNGLTKNTSTTVGLVPGFSHNYFIGLIGLGFPVTIAKDVQVTVEVQEIFGFSEVEPITYDSEDLGVLFRL